MTRINLLFVYIFCLFALGACDTGKNSTTKQSPEHASTEKSSSTEVPSLKEKYEPYFLIGAAADHDSYKTHVDLLKKHFNSLTTENEMKFESLQPEQGKFTFETADNMVAFAGENDMAVRGHALIWHRQTPSWVFYNEDGEQRSREEVMDIMKNHINTVVGHFKGEVDAWDVVNESIMDDGSLRTAEEEADDQKSMWYAILGEEYIAAAFRFAHEADPEAKLFYNDYYNYIPARHQAIYEMLKGLLEQGVPIHGVGIQAHINTTPSSDPNHQSNQQTSANMEKAIKLYSSLGLDVHITEMDVSVYIGGKKYQESDFYTVDTFTEEVQARQAGRYAEFFDLYRRNKDAISSVTFWGIADDNTWLSEFDSGRQDFPMLFDANHQPKPAFHAVMDF